MLRPVCIIAFLMLSIFALSCRKDGCTDPKASNYNKKANREDQSCVYPSINQTVIFPENYLFEREGLSTIELTDPEILEEMKGELMKVLHSADIPGTAIPLLKPHRMLQNIEAPFTSNVLNESGLRLVQFMASNDPFYVQPVSAVMDSITEISQGTLTGSYTANKGQSGIMADGSNAYLMNKNGMVYIQWVEMGLLTSVNLHYINFIGLGPEKMGNSAGHGIENEHLVDGKNYTAMEHNWDMAYGMFSTQTMNIKEAQTAWGKWAADINAITSSYDRLFNYFIRGRYAITHRDMQNRNIVIEEIRHEMDKLCAAVAMYHLAQAGRNMGSDARRNAALSAAAGAIWGLQFCYQQPLSSSLVNEWLMELGNDFYAVEGSKIEATMDKIANRFGLLDERYKF